MKSKTCNTAVAAALIAAGMITNLFAAQPVNLRCEYMKNPLGVDRPAPVLSWEIEAELKARGVRQTAYQVRR